MKNIKFLLLSLFILITIKVYGANNTVFGGGTSFYNGSDKISGTDKETPPAHSQFGWAAAVWGNFAAISAPTEIINDKKAGAVYIYQLTNGTWQFFQKLFSSTPSTWQEFGGTIALYKNTLFVGATGDAGLGGAVHVYEFNGTEWVKKQTLLPKSPIIFQAYGSALDIKDDIAIVSSSSSDETGNASGTVYVYKHTNADWTLETTILSPDENKNDLFGSSIRIVSPEHLVISAPRGNNSVIEAGLVYSFIKSDSIWTVNQIMAADNGRTNGLFGSSIDYSNNRLIIGSMEAQVDSFYSGEAYLYQLDESQKWQHEYRFIPEVPAHHDYFGATVVIDHDFLIIGSPNWDRTVKDSDHGTAYVFHYSDSSWIQAGQLIPEDNEEDDHFGLALALDGNHLVAGCCLDNSPHINNGSSYFYDLSTLVTQISETTIPLTYCLSQNYPNPFNPSTTINYALPVRAHVKITIFDILGRQVVELVNKEETAGIKQVIWNGKNFNGLPVSSGTFIYQIESNKFKESKKMLLLK